jgi:plastocyanin
VNVKRALLLCVVVLAAAGCGGYGGSKSGNSTSTSGGGEGGKKVIAGVQANDHGSKTVGDEVKVELDDYYFEPTVLKGKPGQKVTLELENEGKVEHNFSIASQGVDQDVEAGEDAKVTVTIPKSGALSFFCKYHKSMGMAGALTSGGTGSSTQTGTSTGDGYP